MAGRRVDWRPVARADLLGIIDYICDDNPDAAQRLKDEIEAKAATLADFPKRYKVGRVAGTREMPVRANYIVVYAEIDEGVAILRLLHGAQQWPPVA
jgi:addiction module RelE/StbE family toxin